MDEAFNYYNSFRAKSLNKYRIDDILICVGFNTSG